MFKGVYSGASAMEVYSRQQEVIASNLAHVSTPGYRRQLLSFQENLRQTELGPQAAPGASVRTMATDFMQGIKQDTGRPLDLSISGEGFFVFQGEEGELYSRAGVLFRSPDGILTNSDGLPLLGDGQPIQIPQGIDDSEILIDGSGRITANGAQLGNIQIVNVDDPQALGSASQIYFTRGNANIVQAENFTILQGSRELSNSRPVSELIGLIVGTRSFEASQRAIRTLSDAMQESIRS